MMSAISSLIPAGMPGTTRSNAIAGAGDAMASAFAMLFALMPGMGDGGDGATGTAPPGTGDGAPEDGSTADTDGKDLPSDADALPMTQVPGPVPMPLPVMPPPTSEPAAPQSVTPDALAAPITTLLAAMPPVPPSHRAGVTASAGQTKTDAQAVAQAVSPGQGETEAQPAAPPVRPPLAARKDDAKTAPLTVAVTINDMGHPAAAMPITVDPAKHMASMPPAMVAPTMRTIAASAMMVTATAPVPPDTDGLFQAAPTPLEPGADSPTAALLPPTPVSPGMPAAPVILPVMVPASDRVGDTPVRQAIPIRFTMMADAIPAAAPIPVLTDPGSVPGILPAMVPASERIGDTPVRQAMPMRFAMTPDTTSVPVISSAMVPSSERVGDTPVRQAMPMRFVMTPAAPSVAAPTPVQPDPAAPPVIASAMVPSPERAGDAPLRPAVPVRFSVTTDTKAPVAAPLPVPAPAPLLQPGQTAPAIQLFGVSPRAEQGGTDPLSDRYRDEPRLSVDPAALTRADSLTPAPVVATTGAEHAPLDMTQHHWPQGMIDRIDRMREDAATADTRIQLSPDALGGIAVSLRQEDGRTHIHFTADQAQTATLLTDAQPTLSRLAEEKGMRLGQTGVDLGQSGAGSERQAPPRRPDPVTPVRPAFVAGTHSSDAGEPAAATTRIA